MVLGCLLPRCSLLCRNGVWRGIEFLIRKAGDSSRESLTIMRAVLHPAPKADPKSSANVDPIGVLERAKNLAVLFLLTAAAIAIQGYHPFVEDAEIYVPGIKKLLDPVLYPFNDGFCASHARLTLFPNLIAWSVRITHLPLEWALLAWQFACVFVLLWGCWELGRICFGTARAAYGGAALVASLLTIPVAGTALYIMDQYVNTRSFSTAASVWIAVTMLQRKYVRTALWLLFTALVHPLMAVFGLGLAGVVAWQQRANVAMRPQFVAAFLFLVLFPPVTDAYRQTLDSRPYFFLLRWQWYEWLGIFAPPIIFWWWARMARRRGQHALETLCRACIVFGGLGFLAALVITVPPQGMRFVELQPLRSLQLIYIVLFSIGGALLAEYVLKTKLWRWLALFVPLCAGMFYVQRQLFPATSHIEWPGGNSRNPWVQAFLWVRDHTPVNSYFALDPDHMRLAGEDQHGFRAIAERSMLADRVKDSGAVTMFPALAGTWLEQVNGEARWASFAEADFERLHSEYGVDWVVLQMPGVAGIECPYRNSAVLVCRIAMGPNGAKAQ